MNTYKIINHNANNASFEVKAHGITQAFKKAHIEIEIKKIETVFNFQGTRNAIAKVKIFFDDFSVNPDFTIIRKE